MFLTVGVDHKFSDNSLIWTNVVNSESVLAPSVEVNPQPRRRMSYFNTSDAMEKRQQSIGASYSKWSTVGEISFLFGLQSTIRKANVVSEELCEKAKWYCVSWLKKEEPLWLI